MGSACNICARKAGLQPIYVPQELLSREPETRPPPFRTSSSPRLLVPDYPRHLEMSVVQRLESMGKVSGGSSNVSTIKMCQKGEELDSWVGVVRKETPDADDRNECAGLNIEFRNMRIFCAEHNKCSDMLAEPRVSNYCTPLIKRAGTPSFAHYDPNSFRVKESSTMVRQQVQKRGTLGPATKTAESATAGVKTRKTLSHFGHCESRSDERGDGFSIPPIDVASARAFSGICDPPVDIMAESHPRTFVAPAAIKEEEEEKWKKAETSPVATAPPAGASADSAPTMGKDSMTSTGACFYTPQRAQGKQSPVFMKLPPDQPRIEISDHHGLADEVTKGSPSEDATQKPEHIPARLVEDSHKSCSSGSMITPRKVNLSIASCRANVFKNVLKAVHRPGLAKSSKDLIMSPRIIEAEPEFDPTDRKPPLGSPDDAEHKEDVTIGHISMIKKRDSSSFVASNWGTSPVVTTIYIDMSIVQKLVDPRERPSIDHSKSGALLGSEKKTKLHRLESDILVPTAADCWPMDRKCAQTQRDPDGQSPQPAQSISHYAILDQLGEYVREI